jgi:tRNA-modifying protein YgfZ
MLLDLSDRAKWKVTGADRVRFLNGQLTNDIASLQPGSAVYACALTAKGKLCADLFVGATKDSLTLDAEAVLREALAARLEKYIIADDVTLEDVTEAFGIFHLVDDEERVGGTEERFGVSAFRRLGVGNIVEMGQRGERAGAEGLDLPSEVERIVCHRFGVPGVDLWFPPELSAVMMERLQQVPVGPEAAENLRIEQGIARWGNELSEDVIPTEAGLDQRAINYFKGCYLGQEVISRIKSVGHVNRHLRGFRPASGVVLGIGDKLFADAESTKEIGFITSIGRDPSLNRTIALGYARRGFDTPGSTLQVRRNNTLIGAIEVCSLPFNGKTEEKKTTTENTEFTDG